MTPRFEPLGPRSYVAKIKGLVSDEAPTDDELRAVLRDPAALRDLVGDWMKKPAFKRVMIGFFRKAFQQGPVDPDALGAQFGEDLWYFSRYRLALDLSESFPRTAWQLAFVEGRPFTETLTTTRFMITPLLAAFLTAMEIHHVDDQGRVTDLLSARPGGFTFSACHATGYIPISESIDPASPNYLRFGLAEAPVPMGCPDTLLVVNHPASLFDYLLGQPFRVNDCYAPGGRALFDSSEFDAWRMVTLRTPRDGEAPTPFYDLNVLRGADEIVVRAPRVGFFTTPAFFAKWPTNGSNQARVTMNQTLIVALNRSFDDRSNVVPRAEPALDADHASQPACYACHKSLDPMRQVFRQAYTFSYGAQLDPAQTAVAGVFAVEGVDKPLADLRDLGATLAAHPLFASAWAQKLCNWANGVACVEDDPEFLRLVEAFRRGFDFRSLMLELLTSPLVTGARSTLTFADQGMAVSVSARERFCAAMSARLDLPDVCDFYDSNVASLIPTDDFTRGAVASSFAADPTLFFVAAIERLCNTFADLAVDGRYSSADPAAAIAEMVEDVMRVAPSDERYEDLRQILSDHFESAKREPATTATTALRSTFVLACEAPTSTSSGL